MAQLKLPYPLLVGRLSAGRWSSQVPDELEFAGRLGVAVGADLADARAAPGQTPMGDPFVALVHAAAREQCSPEFPGRSPSRSCASGHSGH
ncbi:MAG TPA: hypothetical protein VHW04_03530 [Solirubrobacteraceae bacterium]|nr:hypothetical protein [Solirubrobacteraceae bacterium]